MQTIETLASWIEACIADPAAFLHDALPRDVADLGRRYRFFKACGASESIDCHACDTPHPCPVRRLEDPAYEYFCHRQGWQPIDRTAVELVCFSRHELIAAIATAAGCSTSGQQDQPGYPCRIGEINTSSGQRTWTLVYADSLTDPAWLTVLVQTLKRMKPGGLVITPSRITPLMPLPKLFVLARLQDVIRTEGGKLVFHVSAALDLLGQHRDAPGKPGRTSPIDMEKALWISYRNDADWPAGNFAAQADFLLARWPRDEKAPRANLRGTVADHISRHREAWGAEAESAESPMTR